MDSSYWTGPGACRYDNGFGLHIEDGPCDLHNYLVESEVRSSLRVDSIILTCPARGFVYYPLSWVSKKIKHMCPLQVPVWNAVQFSWRFFLQKGGVEQTTVLETY